MSRLPDYYLVSREELLANTIYLDDQSEGQNAPWLPNEEAFLIFILGLLGVQIKTVRNRMEQLKYVEKIIDTPQFYRWIDETLPAKVWEYAPKSYQFVENFYQLGKRAAGNDMQVKTIVDSADHTAMKFLKNYQFDLVTNLTDDMRRGIRQAIWEGVATGKSMPQIAASLEKVVTEPLAVTNKKTGKIMRRISPAVRARMIARTETMRAVNQGILTTYMQYGITSIDIRTARGACTNCIAAANEGPFPINDIPVEALLPKHTHCRCVYSRGQLAPRSYSPVDEFMTLTTGKVVDVLETV